MPRHPVLALLEARYPTRQDFRHRRGARALEELDVAYDEGRAGGTFKNGKSAARQTRALCARVGPALTPVLYVTDHPTQPKRYVLERYFVCELNFNDIASAGHDPAASLFAAFATLQDTGDTLDALAREAAAVGHLNQEQVEAVLRFMERIAPYLPTEDASAALPSFSSDQLQTLIDDNRLDLTPEQILGLARNIPNPTQVVPPLRPDTASLYAAQFQDADIPALLQHLQQQAPNIADALALHAEHARRSQALQQFEEHLNAGDWQEKRHWQPFFKEHTWMFAIGLQHQFLELQQPEAHVRPTLIDGTGEKIVDFLMRTGAPSRSFVLVEIKGSTKQLMASYDRGFRPAEDLGGGVVQLATYIRDVLSEEPCRTLSNQTGIDLTPPSAVLLIGNQARMGEEQRQAFKTFRQSLHTIEVVTYDELLARAKYIVDKLLEANDSEVHSKP